MTKLFNLKNNVVCLKSNEHCVSGSYLEFKHTKMFFVSFNLTLLNILVTIQMALAEKITSCMGMVTQ